MTGSMIEVVGLAREQLFHKGSKSQHYGVVLELEDGSWYELRRIGGHPFSDPETKALIGKRIKVTGMEDLAARMFRFSKVEVCP
jgi:hypothetical protein